MLKVTKTLTELTK